MLVLLIHLKSASHRADNVAKIAASFGEQHEVQLIDAVAGKAMSLDERDAWMADSAQAPAYPFAMSPGELGCFLSHRLAWQALLESDQDSALVFEDDAIVDTPAVLSMVADAQARGLSYLQLQTREHKSGQRGMVRERPIALRATAQWVTRDAAERLLELSAQVDRPVDTFIQMDWLHGVDVHAVYPSGVEEADARVRATTIQTHKDRRIWPRLVRAVRRARYRAQVRAYTSS